MRAFSVFVHADHSLENRVALEGSRGNNSETTTLHHSLADFTMPIDAGTRRG